jgi:hypothetical protein
MPSWRIAWSVVNGFRAATMTARQSWESLGRSDREKCRDREDDLSDSRHPQQTRGVRLAFSTPRPQVGPVTFFGAARRSSERPPSICLAGVACAAARHGQYAIRASAPELGPAGFPGDWAIGARRQHHARPRSIIDAAATCHRNAPAHRMPLANSGTCKPPRRARSYPRWGTNGINHRRAPIR